MNNENYKLKTRASVSFHGVPVEKIVKTAEVWGVTVYAETGCGAHIWCTVEGGNGVSVSFHNANTAEAEAYIEEHGVS